ncbi:unconventional myosin-IXa isoform X2 [Neocloeon triangulifer]|uniref:unconventional myosin-IXa isoform X2 n=1 Tax=Neocloeon triangulifer TaxID=2078957 RepID=UPI00286F2C7D|nr:unconventional myosin-IXa isoform X2 [Neocloeon triangulifer]
MLLPDQTYDESDGAFVDADLHRDKVQNWLRDSVFAEQPGAAAPPPQQVEAACCVAKRILCTLQTYDRFLQANGIKPEFFCRYREKLALQKLLLRKHAGDCNHGQDASSSNEAVHLQQRLRSLSTELVTLRNRLHVGQPPPPGVHQPQPPLPAQTQPPALPPANKKPLRTTSPQPPLGRHVRGQLPIPAASNAASDASKQQSASAAAAAAARGSNNNLPDRLSQPCTPSNPPAPPLPPVPAPTAVPPPMAPADLEDLIHLPGPLTEDAVLRALQARFSANNYFTNIGPILLSVNPYNDVGNPLTLSSTRGIPLNPKLVRVVQDAVRQQSETGYPQAIILSGGSGSGKTFTSMLLLRQLFDVAGGGPETDAFKHLAAAFTVLRSLGSAKTSTNTESSRIGHFIEVQVTDGALYRTKIHCYFLNQTRVVTPMKDEKNYHIFYQMLAGLTTDERTKLNLDKYSIHNLNYLRYGDTSQDEAEDAARFQAWKTCLGVLGIPFLDVVRVLAAILLLGNVTFVDKPSANSNAGANGNAIEVGVEGESELASVASLLGVPAVSLGRGLTTRTHNVRGQLVKSVCDANMSNMTRDSLAKALYCRTVATIVRRANSLKRLGSTSGTLSSDSNESVHNQAEVASQHASTVGTAGSKSSKSMAALNNAVRHATDGFIGILDMFGFEDPKPSQLEHLCINLCSETMQHFYNTHIFKSSIESCRDEGIRCDVEVDYVDNVPCIDLVSSLRTGLLSMLDVECTMRGNAESYIQKVKVQHKSNPRLFDPRPLEARTFGIQHYAGRVVYDASDFLDTNKDVVPDDLVAVFHKHSCNFGFATHLFGSELKALFARDTAPRGVSFRISPTSHTDLQNGDEPVSTLTQDFHTRLDNLLRTLVHAKPHFVRCVRSNSTEAQTQFERATVMRQIRSLQALETVNLMAGGFPHRMRFKAFNSRYRLLAPFKRLRRTEDRVLEDCHTILQSFALAQQNQADLMKENSSSTVSTSWATGKRHIFLSEGARQQLEEMRNSKRHKSAVLIQCTWRGWHLRRRWPTLRRTLELQLVRPSNNASKNAANAAAANARPRPQPIAGTPPPDIADKCDHKMIQQTCSLFGLDLERPPPVPPSRSYTVTGNTKLGYPQTRLMKMAFPEDGSVENVVLLKGETVLVVGASPRRGHLLVEHSNCTLHVPFQYLELKPTQQQRGVSI